MFGLEQYIVIFLGATIHVLMRYQEENKSREELLGTKNIIASIISMITVVSLVFVFKDFLDFDELPMSWRNLICLQLGYQGDSIFKKLMKRKVDKPIE